MRHEKQRSLKIRSEISIHTPAKGATHLFNVRKHAWGFQSTHPRRVRRGKSNFRPIRLISIHTPAKGATVYGLKSSRSIWNFNPHTREGCDGIGCINNLCLFISIHTPAKGATVILPAPRIILSYFNPHTREGCDFLVYAHYDILCLFQSTHPRRVRLEHG